jgi:hypothetical protein
MILQAILAAKYNKIIDRQEVKTWLISHDIAAILLDKDRTYMIDV